MNLLLWSAMGFGAWYLFGKKAASPALPVVGAPISGTPIQPVTNSLGADEQVALALASKDPNQMRIMAAQLRQQGYPSQATTLEDAALAAQGVSVGSSLLKGLGL